MGGDVDQSWESLAKLPITTYIWISHPWLVGTVKSQIRLMSMTMT
jgi:hypothetical protein